MSRELPRPFPNVTGPDSTTCTSTVRDPTGPDGRVPPRLRVRDRGRTKRNRRGASALTPGTGRGPRPPETSDRGQGSPIDGSSVFGSLEGRTGGSVTCSGHTTDLPDRTRTRSPLPASSSKRGGSRGRSGRSVQCPLGPGRRTPDTGPPNNPTPLIPSPLCPLPTLTSTSPPRPLPRTETGIPRRSFDSTKM